ncbi:MAG: Ig-like domain-containing protein [Acidobacteriota bacterium]|nr:MAG: Ig-like domain-containing protein [Acidobacteriota bacterium]
MKQTISSLIIIAIYTSLIAPIAQTANAQTLMQTRDTQQKDLQQGLKFSLSEGSDQGGSTDPRPPADTSPLDESATSQLLGRMPDLKTEDSDKKDFAKRAGSLPAPKTGNRIPVKFPADDQRDPNATSSDRSLQVLRYSPEGEVSLAPDLSVTFSEPMVAVTGQQEASRTVPVRMEPASDGKWRWLGTKTLMFDTDKRFPMATVFKLTVPAGTKSATGQTLEKDVSWTFTTPPPKIEQHFPGNGSINTRDEIMFLRFDQAIDQQAMLESITVTGAGNRLPIRLATESEINSSRIKYYKDQSQPGRWVAFKALNSEGGTGNALPADSAITVTVNKGAPSAEGPLTTKEAQSFGFRTYGAFKFVEARCGYSGNTECSPFEMWYVRFTNGIDSSSFEQSKVKVEPAVEGLNIYPSGNAIYFQGVKKGRTTYTITIDSSLKDVYGQSLTGGATAKIKVGSAPPNLYAQGGFMTVLDPAGKKPYFSIFTINHKEVRMKVYKVGPEDWHKYQQHVRYLDYDDGTKAPMPGTLLRNETVGIESVADELTETRIDLSRYLSNGYGNLLLFIEPTVRKDKYDRSRVVTWLQSTSIGLDAFVDSDELVGFATELGTGKPMAGVDLRIYPNGGTVSSKGGSDADESYAAWLWNWITSWGTAAPGEIESFGPSGEVIEIDPVEKAQTNTTPANGVLRLPLPAKAAGEPNLLIAKKGNDVAFLPENSDYFWRNTGSWHVNPQNDYLRWFVFDDRKMYKPQEEVSVKGYIRKVTGGELGDVQALGDAASGITFSVKDPRNNEIAKGTANLNAFGAFDLKFKLPDNANLGYARVDLSTQTNLAGGSYNHQFQIQEFRRPEFEVTSKVVTEAPHFVGGHANVEVEAKYYSGGGLAQADVNWTVQANPTNYTPPNRGDFIFGRWIPWWIGGREYYGGGTTQSFQGKTDAAGKHNLRIDFESVKPPRPYQITASSSVQDVNRQTWSSTANLLVHPADLYVGIKSQRNFVQKGEDIKIESIVSDLDGNLVSGREVEIKALLRSWVFDKGKWEEKVVDEQYCTVTSAAEAQMCRFPAKQGGVYTITALVMDDRERFNESEMTVWVAGGKTPPNRSVEQERVEIIPSGKEFKPGETAEILVIAPFTPAEGILTLRREGVVKAERFTMTDSSVTLKIPIEEAYLPNIYAQVDIVGAAERTNDDGEVNKDLAKRPAFASGSINLPVSIASRELTVEAKPKDTTLVPGGETTVDVAVKDFQGEPVANSEVALVVVDESVLALSAYNLANPVSVFYSQRSAGVSDFHSRADVLLSNPKDVAPPPPPPSPSAVGQVSELAALEPGVAAKRQRADITMDGLEMDDAKAAGMNEDGSPITLRKNFDALAVFAPSVRTDSYGNATVKVKLPDNLTRYRVMAVSVDNAKRFGKTESAITARQPLMIRPSAPRFMNFGDKIELPVVVQNQTDKDMTVNVAVRAANATLTAGGGRRVLVRANDREEVRFPVSADMAGTARFQIAGSSGDYSDAAEISLAVWTPATTEAFATYGTTDKDEPIIQPIQAPGDVYSQFGGLEVTTSSTQLQELTDAFIYLYRYRFECTEQVASRMISIAALRDVLKAFKAEEMPSDADIRARFAADMKILQSRQNSDGYFGLWRRDGERYKYPFVTAHTAHALILAKAKGYEVPQEMLDRVKPYLKDIEKHYPSYYPQTVRWTISSYALYVRNLMGDNDAGKAKKLLAEATIEKMPFEALGWLMPVLIDGKNSDEEVLAIKRFLLNRTTETAATAQFNTDYGDDAWLIMHSNRRADGVLLEAMLKAEAAEKGTKTGQSAGDLIPKLVRGLLDHRKKGRWSNTQENVFILLGLDKYFQAYEKVTPDFVTRVWLGNAYAGEQVFKGRSVDFNQLEIPMSYLIDQGGAANLILDKNGPGRLYYRIGMKYAPKDLRLKPADYGFTVLRTYEAVDKPEDVTQGADGGWIIKAGARVRVKLTMVAQARRYHVALVDPLPAGLEILNPDLAVTEFVPNDQNGNTPVIEYGSRSYGGGYYYWRSRWFEHQNFRDERAEAFASLVWGGVYNYTYVARATTPGEFVVPPAKAEEMYHPETFGRTGTDIVHVK